MAEILRRGRPRLSDEEARRAAFTFRATNDLKQKLTKAAEKSERSIAQEIELRLEMSFAREADAGSANASALADLVRIVVSRLEGLTGKSWHEDYSTYLAVSTAIQRIIRMNQPKDAERYEFAEMRYLASAESLAEVKQQIAELERSPDGMEYADPERAMQLAERLNMIKHHQAVWEHHASKLEAGLEEAEPKVEAAMDSLFDVFKLKRA